MLGDLSNNSTTAVDTSHASSVFDVVLRNGQPDPTTLRMASDRPEEHLEEFEPSVAASKEGCLCWSAFLEAMVSRKSRAFAHQLKYRPQ